MREDAKIGTTMRLVKLQRLADKRNFLLAQLPSSLGRLKVSPSDVCVVVSSGSLWLRKALL